MKFTSLWATLSFSSLALAATPADWRSKAIYQVLTDRFARADGSTTATCDVSQGLYCGGGYQGIIKQLDYIQGMGFSAIWISPITFQIPTFTPYGEPWHGYWQQDLYRLNTNFGTADDLRALSTALHNRGMYLMVDIVVNHNGWNSNDGSAVDYSHFNPFNNKEYYHNYCEVDYNNETSIEKCWLGDSNVPLVDLDTESDVVVQGYQTWIKELVSNYSIDGLRLDTTREVNKDFLPGFNAAAGVLITGEVVDGDPSYTCDYQNYMDSVLNYMMYFPLVSAFSSTSGSISNLVWQLNDVKAKCRDSTTLGSFSENHDQPRFASLTSDMALAKNVIAYTIMADGIPIMYEGQEQHFSGAVDPYNREAVWLSGYNTKAPLYTHTAALNQIRNHAVSIDAGWLTWKAQVIYSDTSNVAIRKGDDGYETVTVLTNTGASGSSYELTVPNTGFASGAKVVDVLSCQTATVGTSGSLTVPMQSGLPKIYYPLDLLDCSGICGY